MPKIVVQCATESELLSILTRAEQAGLATLLVRDAGRTVVQAGTATCVGIGPDRPEAIDQITGGLSLVP
jgi:peptidyl-tRNA hydrolase